MNADDDIFGEPAGSRDWPSDAPLPPLGTGGRDHAGVLAVFEGDPIPNPLPPGFCQVVVVSRGRPPGAPTGASDVDGMPAMAFDAMPPRMAREQAIEANERYQSFYNSYSRGEFPRSINAEFEELLRLVDNCLQSIKSKALVARNGGRPSQQEKLLKEVPKLLEQRIPNRQAADKLNVSLSTYERLKRKFLWHRE
jgi:hypothetical protein